MKFYARKDLWLSVTVWSCVIVFVLIGLSPLFVEGVGLIGGLILFLFFFACAGFTAWLWIYTCYELKETGLVIHHGPFTKIVLFDSIKAVKPTRSWVSSSATSYNRVEIKYGNFDVVHVSPLNQETFLLELKQRCPKAIIEINS